MSDGTIGSGHVDADQAELDKAKEALAGLLGGGSTKNYSEIVGGNFARDDIARAAEFGCRLKGSCQNADVCEMINACAEGLDADDIAFVLRVEEEQKEAAYGSLCPDCLEPLEMCECVKPDPRPARLKQVLEQRSDIELPSCGRCGDTATNTYPVAVRHQQADRARSTTVDMKLCERCIEQLGGEDGAIGNKKTGFVINVTQETPIYLRKDGAPLFGRPLDPRDSSNPPIRQPGDSFPNDGFTFLTGTLLCPSCSYGNHISQDPLCHDGSCDCLCRAKG